MILSKKSKSKKKEKKLINNFLLFYFIISLILGSLSVSIVLTTITVREAKTQFLDYMSRSGRSNWIYLPVILFDSLKSHFYKIEKINLEMRFEDVIAFEKIRQEAIIKGLPPRNLLKKAKIILTHENENFKGNARLKGDRAIHWTKLNDTSYKVDLNKDQYLFGMNKFSIQKPIIRNYVHEWIFHEMAQKFDIIKLKYDFIEFSVNGDNRGLYVIEEGFGKELIERNKRRNGPIFGLDEDLNTTNIDPIFEIYNKNYWSLNENKKLAQNASNKLQDFFNNKLNPKEVFDYDKWASFFAIVDFTGTKHGALLKSVKFYYNPINGLFEPIPYDGHRLKPNFNKYNKLYDQKLIIDHLLIPTQDEKINGLGWLNNLFFYNGNLNEEFYSKYIDRLNLITSNEFIDDFLLKNQKQIEKINSHIYADSFWYHDQSAGSGLYFFSKNDFYYQAKIISNKIDKNLKFQILKKNEKNYLIKDFSKQYDLINLDKLICYKLDEKIEVSVNKSIVNFKDNIVNFYNNLDKLLDCRFAQLSKKYSKKSNVFRIDSINPAKKISHFKLESKLNYKKFFDLKNSNLYLRENETIIDNNLYIPKGYKVKIKSNQKILLKNNAFIISNSAWEIGDENGFTSISGTKDNYGGGILVTDTKDISTIINTKFSYLSGIDPYYFSEFNILGSINFNQTKVKVFNSNFENIFSEDAINIFRSSFEMKNNKYLNINSDAIDIDFSEGKIFMSDFENVKNDALDFSGSIIDGKDLFFKNINDKIISVGERSHVKISNITGNDSFIGIVSKDGSDVIVNNITLDGVSIPFAAYKKKKEYEFGFLNVKNYNIKNFYTKWLVDEGSSIMAEDKLITKNTKNILPIIYEKNLSLINSIK